MNLIPTIGEVTTDSIVRQINEAGAAATWPAYKVDLAAVEAALLACLGAVRLEISFRRDEEGGGQ